MFATAQFPGPAIAAPTPRRRAIRRAAPKLAVGRVNGAAMARIRRYLETLRRAGRRAVSIVDMDCGNGAIAIAAARKARMLGFVAILVRGQDRSATNLRVARRNAREAADCAIGYEFAEGVAFDDGEADLLLIGDRTDLGDEAERIRAPDGLVVRHR